MTPNPTSDSRVPPSPRRVASLLPAATEIVCALGMQDRLVLRSHECDMPAGVERLPYVTEPKYQPDGTSYEIDRRIRAIVQEGLSIYRVDADALARIAPDLIITQEQCEVCAVSTDALEAAVAAVMDAKPEILSLLPEDLDQALGDIVRIGIALGDRAAAEGLVGSMRTRMEAISTDVSDSGGSGRPSVLVIEWIEPLMVAGNWIPELVELAGGRPLIGRAGRHSPFVAWDEMRDSDPDVIVVIPCGFTVAQTRAEQERLTELPGWKELRAVRSGRVAVADGHHYFNRPGPRLVDSVEILAEILHPDRIDSGHRGEGWEPI